MPRKKKPTYEEMEDMLIKQCPLSKGTIVVFQKQFDKFLATPVAAMMTLEIMAEDGRNSIPVMIKDFEKHKKNGSTLINLIMALYTYGLATYQDKKNWFIQIHIKIDAENPKSIVTYRLFLNEDIQLLDPFNYIIPKKK